MAQGNHYMKRGTKVHPALAAAYAAAVETKEALTAAMKAHSKTAAKLHSELVELVNLPDGHGMIIGNWECPTSPIGFCIYDIDADNGIEDCLYCHEPSERK
jgi:hypothetical protein